MRWGQVGHEVIATHLKAPSIMGSMVMETSKKDSAQRQTQRAIEHYRRGDLDCAITLAAAAEGMLPTVEDPHMFQALQSHPKAKELDYNLVINWLKHSNGPPTATLDEFEAVVVIARAITKFVAVYHQSTEIFEDFLRHAHKEGHLPKMYRENTG